jgi:hypothetical protein
VTDEVVKRTERWFVREGLPQFVSDFTVRKQILPRTLPFLAGSALAWNLLLVSTPTAGAVIALVVTAGLFWPFTAGLGGTRPPRLSTAGALVVVLVFFLAMVALPLLTWWAWPDRFPPEFSGLVLPTGVILPLVGTLIGAALLALACVATAFGFVALVRHALSDLVHGLWNIPRLLGRSMPVVLFGTLFLFFTGELWQLTDSASWLRVGLVLGLLAVVVGLATWRQVRGHDTPHRFDVTPDAAVEACAGTPLAPIAADTARDLPAEPLAPQQSVNVLLLLTTRQLVQAAMIGLGLFLFFVAVGVAAVPPEVAEVWIGHPPQGSFLPGVPASVLKLAALLAGFGGVSFSVQSMNDAAYREEFFEPVIASVTRSVLVRAVYLAARRTDHSADQPAAAGR